MADPKYSTQDLQDLRDLYNSKDDPSISSTQRLRLVAIGQKQGWDKPAPSTQPVAPSGNGFMGAIQGALGGLKAGGDAALGGIQRFGQALGEDSSATGDALQGLFNQATSGHPLDAIKSMVGGLFGAQQDQQTQMQHENPIRAGLRQGINSTPLGLLLGPQINRGLDRTLHGDPAGGLSDAVQVAAMSGGPEALEALQNKGMGGLGESMVDSSRKTLLRDPELLKQLGKEKGLEATPRLDRATATPQPGPTQSEGMLGRTQELDTVLGRGRDATPSLQRTQVSINTDKAARDSRLASAKTPIKVSDMIDPAYQYVKTLRDKGEPNAQGATSYLRDKVQNWTGAEPLVDQDGKPTESDWGYINRAMLEDKGKSATTWQGEKDTLRDFQSPGEAMKSQGEAVQTQLGGQQPIRDLLIHGIGESLNKVAGPEVGEFNQRMNQTIAIQKGLENMAKSDPENLMHAAQYVLGGAGAGAGAAMGFGHPEIIGAASFTGGVTGAMHYLAKKLATDPIARAQMGDFLRKHQNNQLIPQTFGNVPKLRILGGSPASQPPTQGN